MPIHSEKAKLLSSSAMKKSRNSTGKSPLSAIRPYSWNKVRSAASVLFDMSTYESDTEPLTGREVEDLKRTE